MTTYMKIRQEEGFYSVDPLPAAEELADFYEKVYYQESASDTYQQSYSEDELKQKRLRVELLFYSLELQGKSAGRLLEVGCGEGFVLREAQKRGYTISGLDFSIHGVAQFNPEVADSVTTGDAFELLDNYMEKGARFDVCVLQNVLEHVLDPVRLLARLKQLMSESGTLVISVPNDFSSLQSQALDQGIASSEYWFSPPQHLHYFNTETLPCFLRANGYRVIDAYADFPIEMFLFHPGSNYSQDSSLGRNAHKARVALDLLLAQNGIEAYHRYCQSLTGCGLGRILQ